MADQDGCYTPTESGGAEYGEYDVSKIIVAIGFLLGASAGCIVGALAATAQTIREAAEQPSKGPVRR